MVKEMTNANLALTGGKPLIEKPFSVFKTIGSREREAVGRVMDSGTLSAFYGSYGDDFLG